jgi:transketolase
LRTAFIETLCQLAEQDQSIWLLTGDLGYSVLERFAERFPDRYVNVGVAEQNLTSIAAGLAMCGKTVFTYSIANFPTLRCLEQIRNDVCYHRANVKVVAVGGGLAYGPQGYTHFGLEDLAILRTLPYMSVLAPGDPVETRLATRAIAGRAGPCYLRLGKAREPVVHVAEPDFEIGRAIRVRAGADATLIVTGGLLSAVVQAADQLALRGVSAAVLSLPTVHPLDAPAVVEAAAQTGLICVVEEHGAVGGLADAVARALVGRCSSRIIFLNVDTESLLAAHTVGDQAYLTARCGLSAEGIARTVLDALGRMGKDEGLRTRN